MRKLSFVAFGLLAACSSAPGDDLGTSESAIKNCPIGNPDCYEPPPTVTCNGATGSVYPSTTSVPMGGSVTVSWNASLPVRCNEEVLLNGVPVARSGSQTFTINNNTFFILSVGSGAKLAQTPTVMPTYPNPLRISQNTVTSGLQLRDALQIPNETILLEDGLDLDISNQDLMKVASGVTLTSESSYFRIPIGPMAFAPGPNLVVNLPRGPVARTPRSLGPRLHTSGRPQALFEIDGATNVHINGFRLEGADQGIVDGDNNYARAIQLSSCLGVDISNMEISGFSGMAIFVQDRDGLQTSMLDAPQIHIHDNYIHNNQHSGTNGYGVDTQPNSWALIEHNVFDYNRHSITSTGQPGSGYRAQGNLQLRGGGIQGHWYDETIHVFDVHGDQDCTWDTAKSFLCGNAGTRFEFINNAMQYTSDNDIKIRGTPVDLVLIDGNVFARDEDDAVAQTQGWTNITVTNNNQYNVDTYGEYGVCDVDGDGTDDLFLATGASWWFMSGGKMQWTFLSEHPERLADIRLGDFDGDHRCDVLGSDPNGGALRIASGGGATWTSLGAAYASIPMSQIAVGDFNGDHIADIFERAPDGGWFYASPGRFDWTYLGGSSLGLASLKLGDFDGDGRTDILGAPGGTLQISSGGTQSWAPLPNNLGDLSAAFVGNVDGLAGDDLVRFVKDSTTAGHWEISSGARGAWQSITYGSWPDEGSASNATDHVHTYLGHFNGSAASADVLTLSNSRQSQISTTANRTLTAYGLFPY